MTIKVLKETVQGYFVECSGGRMQAVFCKNWSPVRVEWRFDACAGLPFEIAGAPSGTHPQSCDVWMLCADESRCSHGAAGCQRKSWRYGMITQTTRAAGHPNLDGVQGFWAL